MSPSFLGRFGSGRSVLMFVLILFAVTAAGCAVDKTDGPAAGYAAVAADADRVVYVETLDDMTFDPPVLEVTAGETVTFRVTNQGKLPHEFVLGDEALQAAHKKEMESHGGEPHDHLNSVWLQPGETKDLTWTFPSGATVLYGCHVPGHYEAGMVGRVGVST